MTPQGARTAVMSPGGARRWQETSLMSRVRAAALKPSTSVGTFRSALWGGGPTDACLSGGKVGN